MITVVLSSRALTEHLVTPTPVWIFALDHPCRDRRTKVSEDLQCFARRRRSQHVRDEPREGFLRCDTKKRESMALCSSAITYTASLI